MCIRDRLEAHPELLDSDGNRVDGYVATWGAPSQQDEEDYKLASFYFVDGHVPKALRLRLDIQDTGRGKEGLASATAIPTPAPTAPPGGPWHDAEPSQLPPALTTFTFGLTIDPNLLGPGRSIALDLSLIHIYRHAGHPAAALPGGLGAQGSALAGTEVAAHGVHFLCLKK